MSDKFDELLKGQEYLGTVSDMSTTTTSKILHMIFIVDISGSMSGDRIDHVNEAFEEMVRALMDIQNEVRDAFELRISIITFGTHAEWIVAPTPILEYRHKELKANGGGTSYGNAFEELNKYLNEQHYMSHSGKKVEPYIMFMTDGEPNDKGYDAVLDKLKNNLWYSHAQRYAVLIGRDAIHNTKARRAVESFVADPEECIITAREAKEIVEVVSAKTIHTIKQKTMHTGHEHDGSEVRKSTGSVSPINIISEPSPSGGENPFGTDWEVDLKDVYGGDMVF